MVAKAQIKEYESKLQGLITECCMAALKKCKESDNIFTLEFFSSQEGSFLELRDKTCVVISKIRLRSYDFENESIAFDNGKKLIEYFKEQIINAKEMLKKFNKI